MFKFLFKKKEEVFSFNINELKNATYLSIAELTHSGELVWSDYRDAYGSAEILHQCLKDLNSDDEDKWKDAINEGLLSRAYHQGDLYTATAYSIFELANQCSKLKPEVREEVIYFVNLCGERGDDSVLVERSEVTKINSGELKLLKISEAVDFFNKMHVQSKS